MPRFAGSDHDWQLPSISRRRWLAEAGAACTALGAANLLTSDSAAAQDKPANQPKPAAQDKPAATVDADGYIDAHVHVWTPDVKKYPLAPGYKPADMKPPSFTPEELFSHARPCGVSRIVLIQMSFYKYDNSYMLEAMKPYFGTFMQFVHVAKCDDNDCWGSKAFYGQWESDAPKYQSLRDFQSRNNLSLIHI